MHGNLRIDPATGERFLAVPIRGRQILSNPLLNKGMAFTQREREVLFDAIGTLAVRAKRTLDDELRERGLI